MTFKNLKMTDMNLVRIGCFVYFLVWLAVTLNKATIF